MARHRPGLFFACFSPVTRVGEGRPSKSPTLLPCSFPHGRRLDLRIALGIEYDGTDFLGWQRLTHGHTVQGAVESALSFVAAHPVEVTCAGRTDAGVHARCQVVHFDSASERSARGWTLGANSRLPVSVAVLWA